MIAVDGDSVAMVTETGVPASQKWPVLLGQARGMPVESFARRRATARDCAIRMWRIIARRPRWYALMLGQWSQNHETPEQFERYLRLIIEQMHMQGIQVCLMTPPTEVADLMPYLSTLHKCATIYRVGVVDVFEHFQREGASADWFESDSTVKCHLSKLGAENVIKCFNQPETSHLCAP
jgi:hypothetical protein